MELFLPEEYPMSAPKVRFMTKIYHPNIDKLGRICLDILKGEGLEVALVRLYSMTDEVMFWGLSRQVESCSTNKNSSALNSSSFERSKS